MKAFLQFLTFLFLLNYTGASGTAASAANTNPSSSPEQDAEACIMPFLDVLANPPSGSARAFQVRGRIEAIAGLSFPGEFPQFELAVEPPNRLRLQFPIGDTLIIACRNDQQLWASPGAQIESLIALLPPPTKKAQKQTHLPPIQLPFTGKQLQLFPALLQIAPKGSAPLDGNPCQVVDMRLQPQLAQFLPKEIEGWAIRLWISAQNKPVRIGVQRPGGSAVIRIDQIQFAPTLPADLWVPPPGATVIPPQRLHMLLNSFGKTLQKTDSASSSQKKDN